jgi:hypothetical protein
MELSNEGKSRVDTFLRTTPIRLASEGAVIKSWSDFKHGVIGSERVLNNDLISSHALSQGASYPDFCR